jgi:transposase
MFSQTANGTKASAVLYLVVKTAKANGLTPYNYITYLLEQFSQPEQDLERLMPWDFNLGQTSLRDSYGESYIELSLIAHLE